MIVSYIFLSLTVISTVPEAAVLFFIPRLDHGEGTRRDTSGLASLYLGLGAPSYRGSVIFRSGPEPRDRGSRLRRNHARKSFRGDNRSYVCVRVCLRKPRANRLVWSQFSNGVRR